MPPDKGPDCGWPEQRYSNRLEVGFNSVEFVLRFSQEREGDPAWPVVEVVTHPTFAKAFSETLADAVQSFEDRFGEIPPNEDDFFRGVDY